MGYGISIAVTREFFLTRPVQTSQPEVVSLAKGVNIDAGAHTVRMDALDADYWRKRFVGGRRVALGNFCFKAIGCLLMVLVLLWRPQGLYPVANR